MKNIRIMWNAKSKKYELLKKSNLRVSYFIYSILKFFFRVAAF